MMSALDNYILICKKTNEVFDGCASTDNLRKIGHMDSLKDAVKLAEDYEEYLWSEGSYLKFGIHFSKTIRGFKVIRKKE